MVLITNPDTRIDLQSLTERLAAAGLDTRIEVVSHSERRAWTSRTETKEDLSWKEKLSLPENKHLVSS